MNCVVRGSGEIRGFDSNYSTQEFEICGVYSEKVFVGKWEGFESVDEDGDKGSLENPDFSAVW